MKKKSPRGIPDFASKRPASKLPEAKQQRATPAVAPHPAPAAQTKPWSTSAKSGRRGG